MKPFFIILRPIYQLQNHFISSEICYFKINTTSFIIILPEITCNGLAKIKNGNIGNELCTEALTPVGTLCKFWCDAGYKMIGLNHKTCLITGLWSNEQTLLCVGKVALLENL